MKENNNKHNIHETKERIAYYKNKVLGERSPLSLEDIKGLNATIVSTVPSGLQMKRTLFYYFVNNKYFEAAQKCIYSNLVNQKSFLEIHSKNNIACKMLENGSNKPEWNDLFYHAVDKKLIDDEALCNNQGSAGNIKKYLMEHNRFDDILKLLEEGLLIAEGIKFNINDLKEIQTGANKNLVSKVQSIFNSRNLNQNNIELFDNSIKNNNIFSFINNDYNENNFKIFNEEFQDITKQQKKISNNNINYKSLSLNDSKNLNNSNIIKVANNFNKNINNFFHSNDFHQHLQEKYKNLKEEYENKLLQTEKLVEDESKKDNHIETLDFLLKNNQDDDILGICDKYIKEEGDIPINYIYKKNDDYQKRQYKYVVQNKQLNKHECCNNKLFKFTYNIAESTFTFYDHNNSKPDNSHKYIFIPAGRGENAYIPSNLENDKCKVVVILSEQQLEKLNYKLPKGISALIINKLSSKHFGNHEVDPINSKRIAIFIFALYIGISKFFKFDDNLDKLYINKLETSNNLNKKTTNEYDNDISVNQLFDSLNEIFTGCKATSMSLESLSYIEKNRDDNMGCKNFFINLDNVKEMLCSLTNTKKYNPEAVFLMFFCLGKMGRLWGEDFLFQRFFSLTKTTEDKPYTNLNLDCGAILRAKSI